MPCLLHYCPLLLEGSFLVPQVVWIQVEEFLRKIHLAEEES